MTTILLVDDEKEFVLSLAEGLHAYFRNINVLTAENGKKAIDLLGAREINMVITDLKMPVMDGFELIERMQKNLPAMPVVVMTAFNDDAAGQRLMKMGITQIIDKPADFHAVIAIVERIVNAGALS
jgi:DNA-binding NtrC family response regulator